MQEGSFWVDPLRMGRISLKKKKRTNEGKKKVCLHLHVQIPPLLQKPLPPKSLPGAPFNAKVSSVLFWNPITLYLPSSFGTYHHYLVFMYVWGFSYLEFKERSLWAFLAHSGHLTTKWNWRAQFEGRNRGPKTRGGTVGPWVRVPSCTRSSARLLWTVAGALPRQRECVSPGPSRQPHPALMIRAPQAVSLPWVNPQNTWSLGYNETPPGRLWPLSGCFLVEVFHFILTTERNRW